MADIFLKNDAISLLEDKQVLLIGDSNVRALYKDLIWLTQSNSLIDPSFLKRRLEKQFLGDNLIFRSKITRGRDFTEHRVFELGQTKIEFLFVTKCFSKRIEDLFHNIQKGERVPPDVVYMNSCLWDISRWGPNGVKDFQMNMRKLMKLLTSTLPSKTLFIWGTAIPTASSTSGGLIIKQLEFMQAALRVHVMEANKFTSALVSSYGFDVLDFHHFMHYQVCRRSADGIHYLPHGMRFMTNLLLTHLALSWDVALPRRISEFQGPFEKILRAATNVMTEEVNGMVKKMDDIATNLLPCVQETSIKAEPKKKPRRNNTKMNQISPVPKASKTPPQNKTSPKNKNLPKNKTPRKNKNLPENKTPPKNKTSPQNKTPTKNKTPPQKKALPKNKTPPQKKTPPKNKTSSKKKKQAASKSNIVHQAGNILSLVNDITSASITYFNELRFSYGIDVQPENGLTYSSVNTGNRSTRQYVPSNVCNVYNDPYNLINTAYFTNPLQMSTGYQPSWRYNNQDYVRTTRTVRQQITYDKKVAYQNPYDRTAYQGHDWGMSYHTGYQYGQNVNQYSNGIGAIRTTGYPTQNRHSPYRRTRQSRRNR